MPTYDYQCRGECGKVTTEFHGIKERREECTECGGRLERLISGGAGIHYHGRGWNRPQEAVMREALEKGKQERIAAQDAARDKDPYGSYDASLTDGF